MHRRCAGPIGIGQKVIVRETLPNGVKLIAQEMTGFRSVSMAVWIQAGSVYEIGAESGISHFIEHMVFKGTESRSASDIAAEMDAVGGSINAYTAKECTCFYAKVLGENIDLAADMLSDIACRPSLDPADIEREKGVVCEEILMLEDDPEDLAHETLSAVIYGDSPLSRPILGTQDTVRAFTRDDILSYMDKRYIPQNMVVSCAGNFKMEELRAAVNKRFDRRGRGDSYVPPKNQLIKEKRFRAVEKDIEQVHICLGFPGFPGDTEEQFALLASAGVRDPATPEAVPKDTRGTRDGILRVLIPHELFRYRLFHPLCRHRGKAGRQGGGAYAQGDRFRQEGRHNQRRIRPQQAAAERQLSLRP